MFARRPKPSVALRVSRLAKKLVCCISGITAKRKQRYTMAAILKHHTAQIIPLNRTLVQNAANGRKEPFLTNYASRGNVRNRNRQTSLCLPIPIDHLRSGLSRTNRRSSSQLNQVYSHRRVSLTYALNSAPNLAFIKRSSRGITTFEMTRSATRSVPKTQRFSNQIPAAR